MHAHKLLAGLPLLCAMACGDPTGGASEAGSDATSASSSETDGGTSGDSTSEETASEGTSGGTSSGTTSSTATGSTDTTDSGETEASSGSETGEAIDTAALQALLDAALEIAPPGVDGITLVVHNADDERVIELFAGDLATDKRIPVASASKYVSALVLMRLIDAGILDLEDTPGEVLGWQGPVADATLDQLAAFVSGLPGEHLCTLNPVMTLDECVATLDMIEPVGAPGELFAYGSAHLATAASMAQALSGKPWSTLFDEEVKAPHGIDSGEVKYYTVPFEDSGIGEINPLVAGGLVISIDEYMPILATLFHRGMAGEETLVDPLLMERFFRNDYPDATTDEPAIGPYSFGSWLFCGSGVHTCDVVSSPGAFGFTPWVYDQPGEQPYYAILGMRADDGGGAPFSVGVVIELMPLIQEALGGG